MGQKRKGLVAKGIEQGMWPEETRHKAAAIYATIGDVKETARLCEVPESTIKNWRKQLWFYDIIQEIREENNEAIDVTFNAIINKSLTQILDRVENGDVVFDRKGALVRRPLTAKDLSLVAAINIDKRQLLRGEPTSRSESVSTESDTAVTRIEKLAETFEHLAQNAQTKLREEDPVPLEGQVATR